MSGNAPTSMPVTLLGGGCASLSLAARADEFSGHHFTVIDPETHQPADHIWGFWDMPWLGRTHDIIRKRWFKWNIISHDISVTAASQSHPYCALNRHSWIDKCRQQAIGNGVQFKNTQKAGQNILDSRPPAIPDGMMLQHFLGYEITADHSVFDDTTAILMDFRCDQSNGMHFIYCLPFSDRHALVESTIFSSQTVAEAFYAAAIKDYLHDIVGVNSFSIMRREQGVIPLGILKPRDPNLPGIGGNGGAIRPSSGYAFSFIQKQIEQIQQNSMPGQQLIPACPHSRFDLWMDNIFLAVIRQRPSLAPTIFTAMAQQLTGDEFALFLSGEADPQIYAKVILAMPKMPFLSALFARTPPRPAA